MSRELALMPATELLANYRAKKLSPVEATKAALARIAALNGRFNGFCRVDEDGALAAARASEQRWQRGEAKGLVDGVPTSVKDIVLAKGWPTLRGSKAVSSDQAGRRMRRRWLACASKAPYSWGAPPRRSSAGRA